MFYLSQLVGAPVKSSQDNALAKVCDVIVTLVVPAPPGDQQPKSPIPRVAGILARSGFRGQPVLVPASDITTLSTSGVRLNVAAIGHEPYRLGDNDIQLTRDLWDKQIVDLKIRRVARVNDVVLDEDGHGGWRIAGADVGLGALLRRIKIAGLLRRFAGKEVGANVIEWADMDFFGSNIKSDLVLPHDRLSALHPVELARITDALSYHQGAEVIASLHDTLAADTLEEITATRQTDIMEQIPAERAADIIDEMAPDDASDLIAQLSEKQSRALLEEMSEERAEDVRYLLRYPKHTAGRAMTTDFICVNSSMTVSEVIEANKPRFQSADLIYYMYVISSDEDDTLVGVITVRDLLVQSGDTPVSDFMLTNFLAVRAGEHEQEVARKMAEYNLLALPVVDRNNKLLGVVTVDDALDSLLPEGWKKRLPRIFS